MARPKEFDRDAALAAAILVFAEHGYEGSSTEALLTAMGISRQSLYDTFGDKRRLYLTALRQYNDHSVASLLAHIERGASPLDSLEQALLAFATPGKDGASVGCMGISAVAEFGRADADVAELTDAMARRVQAAFEKLVTRAQAAGELGREVSARSAAHFLRSTISGMKLSARGGSSPAVLRDTARLALRSLR